MDDLEGIRPPATYGRILARSRAINFSMNSDLLTGCLLRTLAASKPHSSLLELGTGAGLGTSWILDGMDASSMLVSVENDREALTIAKEELGHDVRVRFVLGDTAEFLRACRERFDFIYADTWAGKYSHLDIALDLLRPGGFFLVDDMLPQPNWPDGHAGKATTLVSSLSALKNFSVTKLSWSTGLVLCVKRPAR